MKRALIGGLTLVTVVAIGSSALAQGVDPLDANERRTADPFSNTETNNTDTFFDLMHRVQLGNIRSVSEYSRDQQENIGSQASDFRTRQRELLQQSPSQGQPVQAAPQAVPTAPIQTPAQPNGM